jgi:NTE family protein
VVDANTGVSGTWVNSVEGPSGVELVQAVAGTAIDASVSTSFTAFDRTMGDWQSSLIIGVAAYRREIVLSLARVPAGTVAT